MEKENYIYNLVYIYVLYISPMEYYSALKKKEILSFVTTWKKLEDVMLSEISQTEKDRYYTASLTCGT